MKLNVPLDDDVAARIERLAIATGRHRDEIAQQAFERGLKMLDQESRRELSES